MSDFSDMTFIREYDLPPRWDGHRVSWEDGWREEIPVMVCPPPPDDACVECGLHRPVAVKWGRVEVPDAAFLGTLAAFRCMGCGHDDVYDTELQVLWSLGPEDYGVMGSVSVDDDLSHEVERSMSVPEPGNYPPLRLVE